MKTETTMKSPKGIRISQIVLGGIAIALSLAIILSPGVGIATITFLLSITLLVVGIERLVTGFTPSEQSKSSRFGNIGLGALAALLGIAVVAFPLFTTGVLVSLLALGLLFIGIARIIHGISAKNISKWSKGFLVGVGILSLAVSFTVIAYPAFGVSLLTLVLGISLLIIGIQSVAYAISGHQRRTYNPTTATTVEHGR
ncbi:MAG TPA: DUF308 domain-containing protein [Nitrososphaeraceae archaeon]|nr:DUF308 domain-containing protein [Nitrososphaeraceae archaeon]